MKLIKKEEEADCFTDTPASLDNLAPNKGHPLKEVLPRESSCFPTRTTTKINQRGTKKECPRGNIKKGGVINANTP